MNKEEPEISIPSYLFETAFGSKLQKQLSESLCSFNSDKFKEQLTNKLAVLGFLGTDPADINPAQLKDIQQYFQERMFANSGHFPIGSSKYNTSSASSVQSTSSNLSGNSDEPDELLDSIKSKPSSFDNDSLVQTIMNELVSEFSQKMKYPLPTHWVPLSPTVNDALLFSNGSQDVKLTNSPAADAVDYTCITANNPIPSACGVFYYEVTITAGYKNAEVSIGFVTKDSSACPYSKMPGIDSGAFGLNGHQGAFYNIDRVDFNNKFGIGDTIGCGINYYNNAMFYTKNGLLLKNAADDIHYTLIPYVGLKTGNAISTNFGGKEFKFNIISYIKSFKRKIAESITEFSADNLLNEFKLNKDELNVPINAFVKNYFIHDGFVESAKGFKNDLQREVDVDINKEEKAKITDINNDEIEDSHAVNRQIIREYILKDDIDLVIKFLNLNYPNLLLDKNLLFDLKCQKLIELISSGTDTTNSLIKAMQYGKELQMEFKDSPDSVTILNNIATLVAHKNPKESKFGYYLSSNRKLKLIDKLNKKILRHLGEYEISMLEKIMINTMTNLEILNEHKNNESFFINFEQDYMDI